MTYKVELTHSGKGYSIVCPDLPGCASQGETEEEAISKLRIVLSDYLLTKQQSHKPKEVRFIEMPETGANSQPDPTPFRVVPIMNSLPSEWTSHKVEDLLDILEGTERRW